MDIYFYSDKVIQSLEKISKNYSYFLFGQNNLKSSYIGKVSSDPFFIVPTYYTKGDIKNKLFAEVETFYSVCDPKNTYQKNYKPFIQDQSKTLSIGYGVIITESDLLVLDIDNKWEYKELLNICPTIVSECNFKRVNIEDSYKMHLYYKKPSGFNTSGNVRKVKLDREKIWICGLNKKKPPSFIDTAHLFRGENYNYDLIGHMDNITECPQIIIDKIVENEIKSKMFPK